MRLLTCHTPSHQVFSQQFLDSLPNDVTLHTCLYKQECPSGEFAEEGWNQTTARKFEFLLDQMEEMQECEIFVFSDIDVQFFQPLYEIAKKALQNVDIAFQNDYYGHACTGFFFARNKPETRDFFARALAIIKDHRDDQAAVNYLLSTEPGVVNYGLLPVEFFTFGCFYKHWEGETNFPIPDNIFVHHANWVKGIDKKLLLLKTVRDIYNKKNGL